MMRSRNIIFLGNNIQNNALELIKKRKIKKACMSQCTQRSHDTERKLFEKNLGKALIDRCEKGNTYKDS